MTNAEIESCIQTIRLLENTFLDDHGMFLNDKHPDNIEKIIAFLHESPCDDCISREQTLKAFAKKCGGECACCEYNGSGYDNAENCKLIKSIPSVTPSRPKGKLNNIANLTADLKIATREIGGGHLSNKEAESLIWNTAQEIYDRTEELTIKLDDLTEEIKKITGFADADIYLKKKKMHTYYGGDNEQDSR